MVDGKPKETAASRARKQARMDDEAFGLRVAGLSPASLNGDYWINPNDVNGLIESRLRREVGLGVTGLLQALQQSPGADLVGIFMWFSRLAAGKAVFINDRPASLDQVLRAVTFDADVEVIDDSDEDAEADPKASDES